MKETARYPGGHGYKDFWFHEAGHRKNTVVKSLSLVILQRNTSLSVFFAPGWKSLYQIVVTDELQL
jgi:hypothetical protein